MVDYNNTFLLKPEGVKDFLPAETCAKNKAEELILDVLKRWGYQEVVTPTLEYGNIFSSNLKAGLEKRMYRFFDGWGGTLVLRPDWTLPLARLVANHLWKEPMPLRLGYAGNIFRFETPQSGKQRETFQAGGELLGALGTRADSEIIALAIEALNSVGIVDKKICIGHTGFLSNMLTSSGVTRKDREKIINFLIKRDFASLFSYVDKLPLEKEKKSALSSLPELRGGKEVINKAAGLLPDEKGQAFAKEMHALWKDLNEREVNTYITFDFSILRDLNYYTGLVFEIYSPYSGYPLGGGGRYDRLMQYLKSPLPAVGFALSIDQILTIWNQNGQGLKPQLDYFVGYAETRLAQAIKKSSQLRKDGFMTVLDVENLSYSQAREKASAMKARTLIYCGESDISEENLTGEEKAAERGPKDNG